MRISVVSSVLWLLVACGGGTKPAKTPEPVEAVAAAPAAPPEPAAPPAPEKPKMLFAKAVLAPVKGARITGGVVTFSQQAGGDAKVTSEIEGLKAGTYHLVIHDNDTCGPNATQAGPAWAGAAAAPLRFKVGGEELGNLDESEVKLMLDGAAPIMGHVAVLHDDKQGRPGKAMACGPIEAVGSTPTE
jgi:hypothetical protein